MVHNVMQLIASLDRGGAERVVVDLACHLDRDKYRTVVVYLEGDGELEVELQDADIEVIRLPDRAKTDPRTCIALYQLMRRRRIEILHSHIPRPGFWGLSSAYFAKTPVRVYTEHNVQMYQFPLQQLYPAIVRFATDIICVSDRVRKSLHARYPKMGHKLVTIRNGIRADRMVQARGRSRVREEFGFQHEAAVICNVANLREAKAHDQLLKAFARARQALPGPKLLIVGTGHLEQRLRALADRLGISADVAFAGRRSDIPDLLVASDLFVLSSIREGLPITILEAMASGLPVVTTDVGGCAEAVQDGTTGLVVPPNSPDLLAKAIIRVLNDRQLASKMGAAGRARVAECFSLQGFVEQHERLYEAALARTVKRGGK